MNLLELKDKKISELTHMAKDFNIHGAAGMRKQELIFALLQAQIEKNGLIYGKARWSTSGWFRVFESPGLQLSAGPDDIYVSLQDPSL
jgi:transcription termination factor Rho